MTTWVSISCGSYYWPCRQVIFQLRATAHLLAMNSIQWVKTSMFFLICLKNGIEQSVLHLKPWNVYACLFGLSFLVMIWQLKCLQVHQYSVASFLITWKISQWTSLGWWRVEVWCAPRSTASVQPGRIGKTFLDLVHLFQSPLLSNRQGNSISQSLLHYRCLLTSSFLLWLII